MARTRRDKIAIFNSYLIVFVMLIIAFVSGYMFRNLLVKAYGPGYSLLNSTITLSDQYQELVAVVGVIVNFIFLIIKIYNGLFKDRRSDKN